MEDRSGKKLTTQEIAVKIINRISSIAAEFGLMILRWTGHVPSHHFRRLAYRISGIKIGKGSTIHMWANFYNPKNIEIGNDSIIGEGIVLDGRDKIIIGSHVDIASEVMIYNGQHDIDNENFNPIFKPVVIEDYTFIGPRAVILPGVRIGKGAVVGAGAVVAQNIEEYTVVGGVPAKPIRKRNIKDPKYRLGRAAWFR